MSTGPAPTPRIALLVEDQPDVRTLMKLIVAREGFEVWVASTAAEAREKLAQAALDQVSLAIIDLSLPDEEGDALCAPMRARSPNGGIILTSGHGRAVLEEVARRHEGVAILPKPYVPSVLRTTIAQVLGESGEAAPPANA